MIVSKIVAHSELKKLEMTWNHDEKQEYEKAFAEMLTAVKFFIDSKSTVEHRNAVEKINLVRVKSSGKIASLLDSLYAETAVASITNADWWAIETRLANLVDEHRKSSAEKIVIV